VVRPGRRVFVTPPKTHFPLDEGAPYTLLMAGGIGVTPLIAMAHRLHRQGRAFDLHYCTRTRAEAAFAADIAAAPWSGRVRYHASREGARADLAAVIPDWTEGARLYTCGGAAFMDAVFDAARARGWPETALAREYFAVPEAPARENHPFTLVLAGSGREIPVSAAQSATDALADAGIIVPIKCSDGICGVCAGRHDGSVQIEHRDYVLSAAERERRVVLCCSRPAAAGARLTVSLPDTAP